MDSENDSISNQEHDPGLIPEESKQESRMGLIALIIGISSMCCWAFPLIGTAVTIVGIILGVISYRKLGSSFGLVGIILSTIGFVLSIVCSIATIYLAITGNPFNE